MSLGKFILEAAKAKKEGEDTSKGPEHIIMQLRKVETLRGQKPVEFQDKSVHSIPVAHATRALDMHQRLKPIPKGEFEARLAKSHESFMSAIKGEPAPKPEPKIKLAGKSWKEEVDLGEAGAFSYGAKKPKKGTSRYWAIKKGKEDTTPPLEPKDQKVGVAKVTKEAKDDREYGYEGDMAISQLKSIINNSTNLMKMMKPDTDLPEWVQSKITLAQDYIQTAADYLTTEMNEEMELDEASMADVSHTVSGGQTLSGIAKQYGTDLKTLAKANPNITDLNKISIGQKINVPGAAPVPADRPAQSPATGPSTRAALGSTLNKPSAPVNSVRPQGPASGMPKAKYSPMVTGKPDSPVNPMQPKSTIFTQGTNFGKPLQASGPQTSIGGGSPFGSTSYRSTTSGIPTAQAASTAASQLAAQKSAQQKLGSVRMVGGRTTAGYVNSIKNEDVDPTTTASDRGEIKTMVRIGPDGRVKLVKRRVPRKTIAIGDIVDTRPQQVAVESLKANMQKDSLNKLKKQPLANPDAISELPPTQGNKPVGGEEQVQVGKYSVAENTLLNSLYNSLNEENKLKFDSMLDTDGGPEKLLAFAQLQGLDDGSL